MTETTPATTTPPESEAQSSSSEVASVLFEIADMMELKGESAFKSRAYRRAADTILNLPADLIDVWRAGKLMDIPGVGEAISKKIDELMQTGSLGFHQRLLAEVPPGLITITRIPEIGPRTVMAIYNKLGITTLDEFEAAAKEGRIRSVPGQGVKTEQTILKGIAHLRSAPDRLPLATVLPVVRDLIAGLRHRVPAIDRLEAAGSVRRRLPTIGDIDLLATAEQTQPVVDAFISLPQAAEVIGHGDTKASIRLRNGMRVDLLVLPPDRYGSLLHHFTGSQQHNIQLRKHAIERGWLVSEYGLTPMQGDTAAGEVVRCATETEVFSLLGLPYIPPEIREGAGEIEAALNGTLPQLIEVGDLRGDLHMHSEWSDGAKPIEVMARTAIARGYLYACLTDHTHSLTIARGLDEARLMQQAAEIRRLNAQFAAEGLDFRLLHGVEMEILLDGSLDFPDEVLSQLDVVVASVHVGLRQPQEQVTARMVGAMRNPHVDIIAHPTGRLLNSRPPGDFDMEQVIATAAATGTALEVNGSPDRLDLDGRYVRWAVDAGAMLTIDSDSHHPDNFALHAEFGVATARRGWATPASVLNSRPLDELLAYFAEASRRKAERYGERGS